MLPAATAKQCAQRVLSIPDIFSREISDRRVHCGRGGDAASSPSLSTESPPIIGLLPPCPRGSVLLRPPQPSAALGSPRHVPPNTETAGSQCTRRIVRVAGVAMASRGARGSETGSVFSPNGGSLAGKRQLTDNI